MTVNQNLLERSMETVASEPSKPTMFDKYGGVPTVTQIVRDFYHRVLTDLALHRYFENVNTERLIQHQIELIAYIMGKPMREFEKTRLTQVHQPQRITLSAYERLISILRQVLLDAKIEGNDIISIIQKVDEYRSMIVFDA